MNNLTIDEINEGLMNDLKDELSTNGIDFHENNGNIWITIDGKTYSACVKFTECPF